LDLPFITYVTIGRHAGACDPASAGHPAGAQSATLARRLERLEQDELVAHEAVPGDQRAALVGYKLT
jgi:hypothetical protein